MAVNRDCVPFSFSVVKLSIDCLIIIMNVIHSAFEMINQG